MAQKVDAGFPQFLNLGPGDIIEWAALDPNTGDTVSGVVVSNASMTVEDLTGQGVAVPSQGPFMLVPGPGA